MWNLLYYGYSITRHWQNWPKSNCVEWKNQKSIHRRLNPVYWRQWCYWSLAVTRIITAGVFRSTVHYAVQPTDKYTDRPSPLCGESHNQRQYCHLSITVRTIACRGDGPNCRNRTAQLPVVSICAYCLCCYYIWVLITACLLVASVCLFTYAMLYWGNNLQVTLTLELCSTSPN
jgi:hypothetical protein